MLARFVGHMVIDGFALWVAAQVVSGVHFDGNLVALAVLALIFGLLNTFIKPLVLLLTLPLTVITLGLFALVINALFLLLASAFSGSYSVDGFWPALVASVVISIISTVLNWFLPD
jgi:putative membrane protein